MILLAPTAWADVAVPRPPLRGEVPHDLPPPGPPPATNPWPWLGALVVVIAIAAVIVRRSRHRA
ncbi:MAG: hypothetical protein KC621_30610 [Myxococcales bacterium]|nr:hypothetical protein [Myxococcales bacterium]